MTKYLSYTLKVAFEQTPANRVSVSGLLGADKVSVVAGGKAAASTASVPLFGFDSLRIQVADAQPLARVVKLASVDLVAPRLAVERDRAGRINLQQLAAAMPGGMERTLINRHRQNPDSQITYL